MAKIKNKLRTKMRKCNTTHAECNAQLLISALVGFLCDYKYPVEMLTETDINNSDWEWKVLSFKEPFYKDYEEEITKGV